MFPQQKKGSINYKLYSKDRIWIASKKEITKKRKVIFLQMCFNSSYYVPIDCFLSERSSGLGGNPAVNTFVSKLMDNSVTHYIKWVTTSWTHSMRMIRKLNNEK